MLNSLPSPRELLHVRMFDFCVTRPRIVHLQPTDHSHVSFNRWRTVVSGTWKYDDPRLKISHSGCALAWHFQPRVVIFPCPTNDCVSYVLSYDQDGGVGVFPTRWRRFWVLPTKMAMWEFCLQDGGVSESFTHKMAVWEIFYKMATFLTVLPTIWWHGSFAYKMAAFLRIAYKMATMQNKQSVNKNNVEYVLRLQCRIYLVNVTWPSDSSMSDVRHWTVWRSTVTRWTFDNAQRHVTVFRPIG